MRVVRDGELHGDLLALLAKRLGVESYLELGIGYGETLAKVFNATEETRLYAVDTGEPSVRLPGVAYYRQTSAEFLTETAPAEGLRFDLAFIDADHDARSVREDLVALLPLMNEQGLIVLHDTFPAEEADTAPGLCGDAWKVAAGLRESHPGLEAVTLPYSPGLTLIRSSRSHLAW